MTIGRFEREPSEADLPEEIRALFEMTREPFATLGMERLMVIPAMMPVIGAAVQAVQQALAYALIDKRYAAAIVGRLMVDLAIKRECSPLEAWATEREMREAFLAAHPLPYGSQWLPV